MYYSYSYVNNEGHNDWLHPPAPSTSMLVFRSASSLEKQTVGCFRFPGDIKQTRKAAITDFVDLKWNVFIFGQT